MKNNNVKEWTKNIFQGFGIVLIAILLALGLRILVFASFVVPSYSMEPELKAGDYLFVSKLIVGPRVYKNFDFFKGKKVETRRLPGFRNVRRNDVLVFNYPYADNWNHIQMDLSKFLVKRCVALPGDSFYIQDGIYHIKNCQDTLGNYTNQKALSLKKQSEIPKEIFRCFPFDSVHYGWNALNFGPLYIPKAGDLLAIDTMNYRLYKNLIEYETDQKLKLENSKVQLGTSSLDQYRFRLNYYFMAGDWVADSQDSRYWGLLPEDHIVGKVAFIWQSKDLNTGKYRWNRFFKKVK